MLLLSKIRIVHGYLAIHSLESLRDFQTLCDSAPPQDIENCLLVGPQALHGSTKQFCVARGVEWIGWQDSRRALLTNVTSYRR